MKSKETKMMTWRLKFKLAAVVLLGAAALLPFSAKPVSASTCLELPLCKGKHADLGCCSSMWNVGSDKNGLCRLHHINLRGCSI